MIHLSLYSELDADEQEILQAHIESCKECRLELEQQKHFLTMFADNTKLKVSDELLKEARAQLRGALSLERAKSFSNFYLKDKILSFLVSPPKLAFGAAALLLIGFILGGLFISKEKIIIQDSDKIFLDASFSPNDTRISNLQFIDSDPADGKIEFSIDAVKRVNLSGNPGDPEIQNILTYAMLNDQNPGSRLNSINVMDSYLPTKQEGDDLSLDKEVKDALITVVMTDQNAGVRMEALKLISKFNYDESLKQVYLYVLLKDSSSALRIASLNALIDAAKKGYQLKENDVELVMKQAKQDNNNYIRIKSKTLLEEYN